MNRMYKGIQRLKQRLGTDANITVTYKRGSDSITLEGVWFGMQMFRIIDNDTNRVEWSDRDFLIPVEKLVINSNLAQPQRGDRIEVTMPLPYGLQKFEVSAPDNERPWRFSDQQGLLYRVHTKRVLY